MVSRIFPLNSLRCIPRFCVDKANISYRKPTEKLFVWIIKITLYVVFGYIPLLIICILVSGGLTALVVQTVDYCYGGYECMLHVLIIMIMGGVVGFGSSVAIALGFLWEKFKQPKQP